jgi:hypothetical protein
VTYGAIALRSTPSRSASGRNNSLRGATDD